MNKSQIFKKAWDLARIASERHSEHKAFVFGSWIVRNAGVHMKASEFFVECLKSVYAALKNAAAHRVAQQYSAPVNSLNYSGAPLSSERLAVIDMMQRGDRMPAYDAIEMNA